MGEDGSGVAGEVGTIVWVRRRNGSWWPGRILGQHELSASHLMSPRSGTPVKLLGREDASVDWYNLEKSKRVKAFRCGEFDACIEKAEAAQGIPIKKREKYARREDAIIHALELERQMLEGRSSKMGGNLSNIHGGALKELIDYPSEMRIMADGVSGSSKHTKCKKVGLPVAPTAKGKSLSTNIGMGGSLYVNENGTTDMAPHMRGLQDFGLQAASSKRRMCSSGSYESCKRSFPMGNYEDPHPGSIGEADGWSSLGNKKSSSPSKNRRVMIGLNEETKRRDRRRPLLQVLQSSAKLQGSPPMFWNGYASDSMKVWPNSFGYNTYLEEENAFSGIIDPYDSELPEKLHLDPDTEHDETLLSSTSPFVHELIDLGRNEDYGQGAVLVNEQEGCLKRNSTSLHGLPYDNTADGVSRWNLKGKRNIRKLSKRALNLETDRCTYQEGSTRSLHQGLYTGDSDSDFNDKDLGLDLCPADKVGCQSNFQRTSMDDLDNSMDESDDDSGGMPVSTWDGERLHHAPRRRHWDDPHQQFGHAYTDRFHDRIESGLVDVNLEVQASYQGERVPLVSLMSRLNGKAIIGHPLQVETLSDGFTDMLLPEIDSGCNSSQSFGTAAQPVWRTGRRTSLPRIPRPHATSTMVTMEGREGILHNADFDSRNTSNRPFPVLYDETGLAKKQTHSHRPKKKSHKKSSKKASLSNLKTRTLSSLSKGQKNATVKPSSKASPLSILMKPGDTIPMATCVPVKVAFSRILEAVGKSASHAAVHRHHLTGTGSDGRKPS